MEIRDIYFTHANASEPVLKGMNLEAYSGSLTAILGPNGCGKTTLFKCIAGLWEPDRGDIIFGGKNITGYSHDKRAKIIAVVPQEHEPPFPYSVFDAVLMGRTAHVGIFSAPSKKDLLKAEEAINDVGIGHLVDRPYTKISGGERQLTLVARAMAQDAPVMLFDEPTSHLDFRNQLMVLGKINKIIKNRQITAIMTIHDPNLAMLFADCVVMVSEGSVISQGNAFEVINEENIKKIYDVDILLVSVNGTKMVMPKLKA